MTTQPFPDGAEVRRGYCDGAFCRDATWCDVVRCRVGPTWREAMALELCADCLADFAVANVAIPADVKVINIDFPDGRARATEIPHLHVYAESTDGLFHEVKGSVP